ARPQVPGHPVVAATDRLLEPGAERVDPGRQLGVVIDDGLDVDVGVTRQRDDAVRGRHDFQPAALVAAQPGLGAQTLGGRVEMPDPEGDVVSLTPRHLSLLALMLYDE